MSDQSWSYPTGDSSLNAVIKNRVKRFSNRGSDFQNSYIMTNPQSQMLSTFRGSQMNNSAEQNIMSGKAVPSGTVFHQPFDAGRPSAAMSNPTVDHFKPRLSTQQDPMQRGTLQAGPSGRKSMTGLGRPGVAQSTMNFPYASPQAVRPGFKTPGGDRSLATSGKSSMANMTAQSNMTLARSVAISRQASEDFSDMARQKIPEIKQVYTPTPFETCKVLTGNAPSFAYKATYGVVMSLMIMALFYLPLSFFWGIVSDKAERTPLVSRSLPFKKPTRVL